MVLLKARRYCLRRYLGLLLPLFLLLGLVLLLQQLAFRLSSWRPSLASRHELLLGLMLLSLVLGPSSWWPSQLFPANCQHAYDTCPSHMYACI